jgi:hypothetical protein
VEKVMTAPMSSASEWDPEEVLDLLRRESPDGVVAPPSSAWDRPARPGQPSKRVAIGLFSSWHSTVHAAGLLTPGEAAQRRREGERQERHERRQRGELVRETQIQRKQRLREEKLRDIENLVDAGTLTITQADPAQVAAWRREREARGNGSTPDPDPDQDAAGELGNVEADGGHAEEIAEVTAA